MERQLVGNMQQNEVVQGLTNNAPMGLPTDRQAQPVAGRGNIARLGQHPGNDARDNNVQAMSSSSDEDETQPRIVRRRKRPFTDLVRENHRLYNRFMRQKLPKICRELGISSNEDNSEYFHIFNMFKGL